MTDAICPTLIAWSQGNQPTAAECQRVSDWMLEPARAAVWQLDASSVALALSDRTLLLQSIGQKLWQGEVELPLLGDWTGWIATMWALWLPLALKIDRAQRSKALDLVTTQRTQRTQRTQITQTAQAARNTHLFVQGILGGQGTGKTTLSRVLQLLLGELSQQAAVLSIDDLYLTYAERCELKEKDPRFIWRGPPGTHDIDLGIRTFAQIDSAAPGERVSLPRFDKSLNGGQGDRTQPELVPRPTIILFEGWCVGAEPISEDTFSALTELPEQINTEADRLFAYDCNRKLKAYLPLWDYLDSLIVLRPEDYRFSQQWRQQAEKQMIEAGKSGLGGEEIADFVTYFWRALHPQLFIEPLTRASQTDLVVTIRQNHQLGSLSLS